MAAVLSHRHIFGLKGDVNSNIHYLDEQLVLYPSGHNTVIYNTENKIQKFIHGTDGTRGITALAVSPSRRYVAVAERGQRGVINIYDLHTLKKRKVLTTTESTSTEYVSMSFSSNKLLLTQGGAPDWTLVLWQWEKAKTLSSVKVSNAQGGAITQCSFNPTDPTVACVTGEGGVFKAFRIVESAFKPMPNLLQKTEPRNFTCHAWLHDDRVVLGTDSGHLVLFEAGDFLSVLPASPKDGNAIVCMTPFTKGFILGSVGAVLRVFEQCDDAHHYFKQTRVFRVDHSSAMIGDDRSLASIRSIAVSPSEDSLVLSLSTNQLYSLSLSNSDIMRAEEMNFELLSNAFHGPGPQGAKATITGLDTCIRKPLVATCGLDRSVRVWNYADRSTEMCKFFNEEAHSIALHPSGLYLLVGFADKLRLLNLLMDDIRPVKELPVKACRECQFADGGHLFAAVNGNAVQIFSMSTCECIATMRGHNGKVRSLFWAADDSQIVSAGMDGAVYQWDLRENKREGEFVKKGCNYSSAQSNADGDAVFAVGSDRMLREIEFPVSTVTKEIECNVVLGQLVLSHSQRMLFAGTADPDGRPGCVRSYKYPLTGDFSEYACLSSPITRMRLSFDDAFLFVASVVPSRARARARARVRARWLGPRAFNYEPTS